MSIILLPKIQVPLTVLADLPRQQRTLEDPRATLMGLACPFTLFLFTFQTVYVCYVLLLRMLLYILAFDGILKPWKR